MTTELIRITARRVPWPGLREKTDRAGLRLRWDAIGPGGEMLVEATEHPLTDGAFAMLKRGASPDDLVTLRHEGSAHDAWRPAPLAFVAADAARRAEGRARLAAFRATHPANMALDDFAGVEVAAGREGLCFPTVAGACDAH
jgi:hypothetical protein